FMVPVHDVSVAHQVREPGGHGHVRTGTEGECLEFGAARHTVQQEQEPEVGGGGEQLVGGGAAGNVLSVQVLQEAVLHRDVVEVAPPVSPLRQVTAENPVGERSA